MSGPVLRRDPVPWRRLVVSASVTGAVVLVLGVVLGLVGVGLQLPFLVLLAVAVAATSWLVGRVLDPAEPPLSAPPEIDTAHLTTRNLDRRVRVLEKHLWGVQPAHQMNRSEVQRIFAELVAARRGGPAPTATTTTGRTGAGPLPPALADYLSADPPPALSRRQLRTILQETSRL